MCTKYITSYNCNHVLVHKNTTTATHVHYVYEFIKKRKYTTEQHNYQQKQLQSHHEQV